MSEQLSINSKEIVEDIVDVFNEWDDLLVRHKDKFSEAEYEYLISQNDAAYAEALQRGEAAELVAA